jgi:hypothetical protein
MGIDEAIEAEAQAQAICMQTRDFERAYEAFVRKEKPAFKGAPWYPDLRAELLSFPAGKIRRSG